MNKKTYALFHAFSVLLVCSISVSASEKKDALEQLRVKFSQSEQRFAVPRQENGLEILNQSGDGGFFKEHAAYAQKYIAEKLFTPRHDFDSEQVQMTSIAAEAFDKLWRLAADLTNGKIPESRRDEAEAKLLRGISAYGGIEISREKIRNGRFHASCFAIPRAAAWIYFCLYEKMKNPEYAGAKEILRKLTFQAWSVPARGDATDENIVSVERFRNHSWWVGGNATGYRPLLESALVNNSIEMVDVVSKVAFRSLSSQASQCAFPESFWSEGITADGAGWGHGRQCLVWGYPKDGSNGSLGILAHLKGTPWELNAGEKELDVLFNYFRGSSFYFYKGAVPPVVDRNNFNKFTGERKEIPSASTARQLTRAYGGEMPRERAAELQQFLSESKTNALFMLNYPDGQYHGTRYFYNNDDAIKKTPAYYVLINMSSRSTDGLESAYPGAAGYNFYMCDGSVLLEREGGEHKKVLGAYNLTAWPGVTARQVPDLKPVVNWSGYSSSANLAGGVADGSDNFVAGFIFDKENAGRRKLQKNARPDENPGIYDLQANKSYFMFGNTLLALGAGIENKNPKLEGNIWTTLEQTIKSPDYAVASAGGMDWIRNNNVFYAVVTGATSGKTENLVEKRKTRWRQLGGNPPDTEETEVDVLQIWIDHGREVSQGRYAYLAHFGDKTPDKTPVILANSTKVQGASNPDGTLVGAVFYDAASKIDTPLGPLAVTAPCVVMVRKTDGKMSIIVADTGMTEGLDKIGVEIGGHRVDVQLPSGLHQGKQGKAELDSSALEKKVIYYKDVYKIAINEKREGITYPKDSLSRFDSAIKNAEDKITSAKSQIELDEACTAIDAEYEKFIGAVLINEEIFQKLKENYNKLIINTGDKTSSTYIKETETKVSAAKKIWDSMDKSEGRTYLWNDKVPAPNSSNHIMETLGLLRQMAIVYTRNGSELKGNEQLFNDIVKGLIFVCENWYNKSVAVYGNSWNFTLGSPAEISTILSCIADKMEPEQKNYVFDCIKSYVTLKALETATGGNRLDAAMTALKTGYSLKKPEIIIASLKAVEIECKFKSGHGDGAWKLYNDGIYEDGSLIQHFNLAYNLSYGGVLLGNFANFVSVVHGTVFDLPKENYRFMQTWVINGVEPFIYKGMGMSSVLGRAIVRTNNSHGSAKNMADSIYKLAKVSEEPMATLLKSMVKGIAMEDTFTPYTESSFEPLLKDEKIFPRGEMKKNMQFPLMDRVAHLRGSFAFTLGLFSSRIRTFEQTNGENTKGWYTGSGTTYIYNADQAQFSEYYWNTINMYRLPGVTLDTTERSTKSYDGEITSKKDWVGGTSVSGLYGVNGMDLEQWKVSLGAKKSWFMFDDEIVCLGAGINSNDDRSIETIVENRKLNKNGNNAFVVNGANELKELGMQKNLDSVKWCHLNGNVEGADIGYVFPTPASLKYIREKRNLDTEAAPWIKDTSIYNHFLTFWYDHGKNPESATYDYILLPNKTAGQTKEYANNPDVSILANTKEVQAVKENKLGVVGANFWTDPGAEIGGIKSLNMASVMTRETANAVEISVSDPTMKQNEIQLEIDKTGYQVLSTKSGYQQMENTDNIKVEQLNPKIKLKINTRNAHGKTFTVKILTDSKSEKSKIIS